MKYVMGYEKTTDCSHCLDLGCIRIVEQFLMVVIEATHV